MMQFKISTCSDPTNRKTLSATVARNTFCLINTNMVCKELDRKYDYINNLTKKSVFYMVLCIEIWWIFPSLKINYFVLNSHREICFNILKEYWSSLSMYIYYLREHETLSKNIWVIKQNNNMGLDHCTLKIFDNNRNVDPQSHGCHHLESVPHEEL